MYDRLLSMCWSEAARILKPSGILAFTFHHDKDEAWINVLESLFKSGFIIEAAFPIRSDATKGEGRGAFGSKKIEYDIVHVCKKRLHSPPEIYWATLRKKIIESVKSRSFLLAQHKASGLHLADLEVIIRGEVLEQYSKHYGVVKKNLAGDLVSIREILLEANSIAQSLLQFNDQEKMPEIIEANTRTFFSLFRDGTSIEFNAAKKRLKGAGLSLEEFIDFGWVTIIKKNKERIATLTFIGDRWNSLSRKKVTSCDLDQAHFAINCCLGGKQLDGKPADLETWIETNYKNLLPSVIPLLKYLEGNHMGADYKQAIGMAYRTMERTLNKIKESDGEFKKVSDQLNLF
jgi:putative DNA methylase